MTSPADLIRQGRLAEAETLFRQALAAAPDDAGTLTNLGVVLQLQARFDEAEACYRQALALRPDQPMTLNNLGVVLQARDAVEEAIGCFRRAVALRPDYQEALNGLGVALQAEGRLDEAIASFRQVLALRADHAETRLNLATALLVAGDLEAGFRELEWRWRARGRAEHLPEQLPPWSGEPLAGGTLMVLAEQGAGDTFQFIRYLGELKARSGAGRVLMLAAPPLARLLASAEGIDRLLVPGDEPEPFDRYVPLLSLPHHFGTPSLPPYPIFRLPKRWWTLTAGRSTVCRGGRSGWFGAATPAIATTANARCPKTSGRISAGCRGGVGSASIRGRQRPKPACSPITSARSTSRPPSPIGPTPPPPSWPWIWLSPSIPASPISPAPSAGRPGCCCPSPPTGAGCSAAATARGIPACACSVSRGPATGRR